MTPKRLPTIPWYKSQTDRPFTFDYARSRPDHSTMGIAYTTPASTNFDVPRNTETGLNDLRVVCNGIASLPVAVNVQ